MKHKLLTGKALLDEAKRLSAIELIPGNTYNPDVLDKIALAKLCVQLHEWVEGKSNECTVSDVYGKKKKVYTPTDESLEAKSFLDSLGIQ